MDRVMLLALRDCGQGLRSGVRRAFRRCRSNSRFRRKYRDADDLKGALSQRSMSTNDNPGIHVLWSQKFRFRMLDPDMVGTLMSRIILTGGIRRTYGLILRMVGDLDLDLRR